MSLTSVKSGRARAVEAALAVLRAEGIAAVTMRSVADAAGMTAPALYWHYEDKDALLRDLRREVAAIYRDHAYAGLREEGALARLRGVLVAFRDFAVAEPHYYELLFVLRPVAGGRAGPSSTFRILVDRVRDCMQKRELCEDDPVDVAMTLTAHAQGLVMLFRRERFESESQFAQFYDRSLDRLLAGIAST